MIFFSALREETQSYLFHLKMKAINLTMHLWMRAKVHIWGWGGCCFSNTPLTSSVMYPSLLLEMYLCHCSRLAKHFYHTHYSNIALSLNP